LETKINIFRHNLLKIFFIPERDLPKDFIYLPNQSISYAIRFGHKGTFSDPHRDSLKWIWSVIAQSVGEKLFVIFSKYTPRDENFLKELTKYLQLNQNLNKGKKEEEPKVIIGRTLYKLSLFKKNWHKNNSNENAWDYKHFYLKPGDILYFKDYFPHFAVNLAEFNVSILYSTYINTFHQISNLLLEINNLSIKEYQDYKFYFSQYFPNIKEFIQNSDHQNKQDLLDILNNIDETHQYTK